MAAAIAPYVAEVIASDITTEMLSEAAKLAASRQLANTTTATAEAGALPFEDQTFDLVCCRLAAHHFPSLEDYISETRRVLKPGGRFAFVDNVPPDRQCLPEASEEDRRLQRLRKAARSEPQLCATARVLDRSARGRRLLDRGA